MYAILVIIHVLISIFLIAVILLQAGRGGGLSDSFAGSKMQNLFGTKSTAMLTKLTSICAIGFIFTCLSLAIISSHNAKSIVDRARIPYTGQKGPEPIAPKATGTANATSESNTQQGAVPEAVK